jgi:SAM-dependent methyltransferase
MPPREDAYGTQKRLAFANALITAMKPRRVLDFGCGTGAQLTQPLALAFAEVEFTGADSDAASLEFARRNCAAPKLRYTPAAALPEQARYDLVIASEVLEHVELPGAFLRGLAARLEKDGRLLLTVPNGYGPFELASFAREALEAAGVLPFLRACKRRLRAAAPALDTHAFSPHINFFSLRELRAAIAAAGLKVVQFRARTLFCGFGFDRLVRGERLSAWNARLADRLPPQCASDWMFVLELDGPAQRGWEYAPGTFARLRRGLGRVTAHLTPAETRAMLAHRVGLALRFAWWRVRDLWLPTFARSRRRGGALAHGLFRAECIRPSAEIRGVCDHYLAHRFDLLGSGWTLVAHGKSCRGVHGISFPAGLELQADPDGAWLAGRINRSNLAESRRLWRMVSPGYRPIDWQLDFKSGFRWSERTPARRIRFAERAGADVKVPWELARLQHLPHLAQAYALEPAERYAREFRDQALDFIACNPPRFGVNWSSSMDVAIRAANLVVARDLFIGAGASFDAGFEAVLERSIFEHAAHVAATLDWHPRYRGNHYLCGIAGLVFAGAYLGAKNWQRRAIEELQLEARRQFLPDGGSFEASTGYHRLSGEALIYASSLAADELPGGHFDVIRRVARFTEKTAHPDGQAPQIGDQDSGCFLKVAARWHALTVAQAKARYANLDGYNELPHDAVYWDEELRDHSHVVASAAALCGSEGDSAAPAALPVGKREERDATVERLRRLPYENKVQHSFAFGTGKRSAVAFPDFGVYVVRAGTSYLCIRCGPIGLNGLGAHAHNDALSVELVCEARDVMRDPGSYLYTALPQERDRYRSVRAHFAPRIGAAEPATLGPGLFRLGDEARARCLYFGEDGFLGVHYGYGTPVHRFITFADGEILIEDFCDDAPLVRDKWTPLPLSPKYGVRLL